MRRLALIFAIVFVAFASCNRTDNYIIPVDYERFYEGITGLTENESRELNQKIIMAWYDNTVGKEIPDIQVKDLEGKTKKLKKWLKKETILIFADPYCGFGAEEVEKEFPNALRNMKEALEGLDILCLIEVAEDSNEQETMDYAKGLHDEYDNLFIIEQKDALRANLTGSPTLFFIDKNQIVKSMQMGLALDPEGQEMVIRNGISSMRKEKQ